MVTYYPTLSSFHWTTKHHLSTLYASDRLRKAFRLPPLITFRCPRNLRDYLVRAALTPTSQESLGNRPCGASMCKTCPILLAPDEFSSHTTGKHLKIKVNASCKWSNVIYLITCGSCGEQYVDETQQELHCRINGHRYDIAHKRTKESPVAEHFNGAAHLPAYTRVMVIDQLWNHDPCLRKIRESRWIRTVGTTHHSGTNLRVDSL